MICAIKEAFVYSYLSGDDQYLIFYCLLTSYLKTEYVSYAYLRPGVMETLMLILHCVQIFCPFDPLESILVRLFLMQSE